MKSLPRIFMLVATIALALMFVFPLWKITLLAPQYPNGLGMLIWTNRITGTEPGTLQNINILNHYVGMKPIVPDSVPELQYMKYFIMVFSVIALILSFINRWKLNLVWLILLVAAGSLAIYDFHLWEYDYGHDLSLDAPLKFEGMAYQPPLIGKKVILNFTAISFPRLGSLFMALSMLTGGLAVFFGIKNKRAV